jgi:rRNA maturation endonuclease Nob1
MPTKRMKFCIGRCGRTYYGDYPHDVCLACGGNVVDEKIEGL